MSKKQKIMVIAVVIAAILLYSPLTEGMSIGIAALLKGAAGTGLSGIIGYLILVQLQVFTSPSTAKDYAKFWFGYVVALLCIIRLNLFFIYADIEYLAQFTLLVIVYGALAAICGYVFGQFKLRKIGRR